LKRKAGRMIATEQLTTEHKGIQMMLRILDAMCERLESGRAVAAEHLESVVEFLKVFVDKCHHGKEEELLFPALEAAGVPREGGPIGVMLREHNQGRGHVERMSKAAAQYRAGEAKAAADFVGAAKVYMDLLIEHIEKEDGVLYVMADARLSEKKQEELAEGFERIERERIGVGRHEEFHKTMKQLADVYLR